MQLFYLRSFSTNRCFYEPVDLFSFLKRQSTNHFFSLINLYTRFCYFFADRVHVSSEADSLLLSSKFFVPSSKIYIFQNWIDTSLFKPFSKLDSQLISNNKSLLFVGRFTRQKNLHTIIDAISKTNFTLHLVGDGPLRNELRDYAHTQGSNVLFYGNISNTRLPEVLNRYPIFVFPSLYEGNLILEAMACGLVVIANNSRH